MASDRGRVTRDNTMPALVSEVTLVLGAQIETMQNLSVPL